jgi:hypothetical protein
MDTELTLLAALYGVGFTLLCSLLFIVPAIIGKIKKVGHPIQFGFVCGSIVLGIQALLFFALIPFSVLGVFVVPQYCAEDPDWFLCDLTSYIQDNFEIADVALIVFLVIYIPLKLSKSKWPAYVASLKANQSLESDGSDSGAVR